MGCCFRTVGQSDKNKRGGAETHSRWFVTFLASPSFSKNLDPTWHTEHIKLIYIIRQVDQNINLIVSLQPLSSSLLVSNLISLLCAPGITKLFHAGLRAWRYRGAWSPSDPCPLATCNRARGITFLGRVKSRRHVIPVASAKARGAPQHMRLCSREPPPPQPQLFSIPAWIVPFNEGGISGGFGTSCIGTCRTTRCLRVGELIACTNSSCSEPGAGYFSWRRIFLFTGCVPLSSSTFNHANRDKTQTEQRNTLKPHSR